MAKAKRRKGGKSNTWTFLLLVLPAAIVVLPTTILFGIGMVPTMVALVVDRDPEKTAPITVGGLNFCGCMPYAIDLWQHGHSITAAFKVYADPLAWLVIYGAAAAGWAFYYGIPPMVASTEVMRAERRIEALKREKVGLVQAWGPDVAADAFDDSGGFGPGEEPD